MKVEKLLIILLIAIWYLKGIQEISRRRILIAWTNIKIEVNYSLRSHILEAEERPIITELFSSGYKVKSLAPLEIYGSKVNALLSRAVARDLYDARNMIHYGIFDKSEEDMLKKCVVFYAAISAK